MTGKNHFVFVKMLSELCIMSHTIYGSNANMAVTVAQCLLFLQNEGKFIKGGKNHYKLGHVESCSYANGELVGSVRNR